MKTRIFLSHIHEEAELASHIKQEIESLFIGVVDVFVSSDRKSIKAGQRGLDEISKGLRESRAYFLLCSPDSIKRHWIFFEAGAGWVREIPAIPLCHSGIKPADLPAPLNSLQGVELGAIADLDHVIERIAEIAGTRKPLTDLPRFVSWLKTWEARSSTAPRPVNVAPPERVSRDALQLLTEAVNDRHGLIGQTRALDERGLRTNGKAFGTEDRAAEARWEAALKQLCAAQLVEQRDQQGTLFAVTHEGFELARSLKEEPPSPTTGRRRRRRFI